jgi:hypothetical protein
VRKGITVEVSAADRTRLKAIVSDENSPQKTCLASSDCAADGGRHP